MLNQFDFVRLYCIRIVRILGLILAAFFMTLSCSLLNPELVTVSYAESNGDEDVFDDKRGDVSINQETLDKAETAFFKGLAAYRAKKYEDAATHFKAAHQLVPYRDLLFNIARAHEELKQNDKAIKYYKQYLSTKPIDETQIIHRMRQLGVSQFETGLSSKKERSNLQLKADLIPKENQSQIDWLSWSVLGGGAALIGAGSYFGIAALNSAEKARNARVDNIYDQAKSDAESEALIADVTVTLGLAVAAGGLYLLFTQPSASNNLNTAIYQSNSQSNDGYAKKKTKLQINYVPVFNQNLQGLALFGQF